MEATTVAPETLDKDTKIKTGIISTKRGEDGFFWSEEGEPHLARRKAILKDHPEIKKLYGVNPTLKWWTLLWVVVQLTIAFFMGDIISALGNWGWPAFLVISYFVGATIAQAMFLAIHEITHNYAFRKPAHNNWFSYVANLPLVFPYAMSFKFYHAEHHWKQGKDGTDTDIPSHFETKIFRGFVGKILWYLNQILFYAFRPILTKAFPLDKWTVYNIVVQIAFIVPFLYFAGWQGGAYLLLSMFFAGGLHPTAAHFISEHYVFKEGQETYSYYGPLNLVTFNVGYHNEHHDFPNVPGCRLKKVKQTAPEYYDNLASYKSWTGVAIKFLLTPSVTLHSRTKRT